MRKPAYTPQPLITRGQLFQIRAATTFEKLRDANVAKFAAYAELHKRIAEFEAKLPDGYRLEFLPKESGSEEMFACFDAVGSDVAWPVTRAEAHARAWAHAGKAAPELAGDLSYVAAKDAVEACERRCVEISNEIDGIERNTPDPVGV